ncbi:squalene synthase HpnC [Aquabacterium sp. A08]|uniref:squalene synthase HpnC n=1 Tax=Aquabacterium sp. A08 TaxID=2718532 RepID=UPI001421C653|nr:squalene synthase HpnC [Aquabacterium sp. A08]NIC40636.1 squalene synthase HpnC [Aquabacterium sp. A08]
MQGVEHYENFPVASWWCPPRYRAPIAAIYHYARTADDLADEGDAPAAQRLADLAEYRADVLQAVCGGAARPSCRWPQVMAPLARQVAEHRLPLAPLLDLLDAFEQDVRHTADGIRYPDLTALLDYCRRSANPVGRLLLHLYRVDSPDALRQSDAICSALQLVNFWQDLSVDLPRGRHYLPLDALRRHGVAATDLRPGRPAPHAAAMVRELVQHARALMQQGAPLALRLPGRAGWELRLVVQGGLRVLDRIEAQGCRTWEHRPTLRTRDALPLLWRALWMRPGPGPTPAPTGPTESR